jgi:hypothetical protein
MGVAAKHDEHESTEEQNCETAARLNHPGHDQ